MQSWKLPPRPPLLRERSLSRPRLRRPQRPQRRYHHPPFPAAVEAREAPGVVEETPFTDEAVASLVSQERIIIRTVHMGLVVDDVSASVDSVAVLAEEFDGWVVSSSRSEKHFGSISFRVPADQLDVAILRLRGMAVEVESEISTSKDVTEEYFDTRARLESLQAERDAYLLLFESAENVEEALLVRQALTEVQADIEVLQGRINLLERTSAFSLIKRGPEAGTGRDVRGRWPRPDGRRWRSCQIPRLLHAAGWDRRLPLHLGTSATAHLS